MLLLVFLSPALVLGEELRIDDLVEREGIYYKKFSDVPCSEKKTNQREQALKDFVFYCPYAEKGENEQLQGAGHMTTGEREGPWIKYHENGQLESKGYIKNGMLEGPWVGYHKNGQLSIRGTYKDGRRVGIWIQYYEDGTIHEKYTGIFENGEKVK